MSDEDRLIELLEKQRESAERQPELEAEILELIDTYFRRELRPVLTKVFGTGVVGKLLGKDRRADDSLRFTAMAGNFFVKVLEKRPDAFWKARTASDLRRWSSVVIANQMRDYLRRKKRGQQILAELAPLVVQRQTYFEDRYQMSFEDFLNQLAEWESSGDSTRQLQARALRHRYVDGMTWQDITQQLGISDERLARIRESASDELRKKR